jgi:hypothetical protein
MNPAGLRIAELNLPFKIEFSQPFFTAETPDDLIY